MWLTLLLSLLTFLSVIVVLMAIPVSINYQLAWPHGIVRKLEVQWAFGWVKIMLPSRARDIELVDKRNRTKRSNTRGGYAFKLIFNKPFRQRVFRFINDVWYSIKKRGISVRIRAGLEDPADTGQFWAFVGPINASLANSRQLSIDIQPNFVDECFELDSRGFIKFSPLRILILSFGLLLSPIIWQGLRQAQSGN